MKLKSTQMAGHMMALATAFVWGSTFICSKVMLQYYTPVQLMMIRFVLGYVVLWPLRPRWLKPQLKQELIFFAMGMLGCTLYFLAENYALQYTLAANVSIIVALAPILTAILAHIFTKDEKLRPTVWYGFICAMIGVALVVFNGTVVLHLDPRGDFLAFAAALSWAGYSLLIKRCTEQVDSILLARRVNFYGMITGLPILFMRGEQHFPLEPLAKPEVWGSALFLAVLGSAVCYVSWNLVVKYLGVVKANNYIYLQPFITILVAFLLLKEPISWMAFVGAILIVGGVIIASRRGKKW